MTWKFYYRDGSLKTIEALVSSGGAGTDSNAIHSNVAGEIFNISEKTTPIAADILLIEDSASSNIKKKVQIGNLPSSGSLDDIFTSTTQVTVNNTVVETTLFSFTLLGGSLSTNRLLQMRSMIAVESNAGTTYTFRLKYGATTILTIALPVVIANSYYPLFMDLKGDAATNAQEAHGSIIHDQSGSTFRGISARGTAAEDSTANKTLALTVQLGSAGAGITCRHEASSVLGAYVP